MLSSPTNSGTLVWKSLTGKSGQRLPPYNNTVFKSESSLMAAQVVWELAYLIFKI